MNPIYAELFVFVFAFLLGKYVERARLFSQIKDQVWNTVLQSEAIFNQKVVPVFIEKHEKVYYMYEEAGDTGFKNAPTKSPVFVGQGNTKQELIFNARLNRPGALFFVRSFEEFEFEKTDLL